MYVRTGIAYNKDLSKNIFYLENNPNEINNIYKNSEDISVIDDFHILNHYALDLKNKKLLSNGYKYKFSIEFLNSIENFKINLSLLSKYLNTENIKNFSVIFQLNNNNIFFFLEENDFYILKKLLMEFVKSNFIQEIEDEPDFTDIYSKYIIFSKATLLNKQNKLLDILTGERSVKYKKYSLLYYIFRGINIIEKDTIKIKKIQKYLKSKNIKFYELELNLKKEILNNEIAKKELFKYLLYHYLKEKNLPLKKSPTKLLNQFVENVVIESISKNKKINILSSFKKFNRLCEIFGIEKTEYTIFKSKVKLFKEKIISKSKSNNLLIF